MLPLLTIPNLNLTILYHYGFAVCAWYLPGDPDDLFGYLNGHRSFRDGGGMMT